MMRNRLYRADCKSVIDELSNSNTRVDLVYLDPPFNSNRTYSMLFNQRGIAAQQKAYHDIRGISRTAPGSSCWNLKKN